MALSFYLVMTSFLLPFLKYLFERQCPHQVQGLLSRVKKMFCENCPSIVINYIHFFLWVHTGQLKLTKKTYYCYQLANDLSLKCSK